MERQGQATERVLRTFFREAVCCLDRIFTRHRVADDAVWDAVKDLDLLYQRTRRGLRGEGTPDDPVRSDRPHPGILRLIEKLDRERGP
ncbi:MAG: hypothetical protein HY608_04090 [Planctomycetes bacterium]|nr:hypothetical protein [Planctomycetota bacterium]